ncbi:tRNA lysidine(34) synthetase TilS [Candidatus Arthromitus sp. SFB-rat-Yit]|uniref:tRNA lysidine(34) synthetase TilS n=1 Tax=Candidatus Arthromitus sp. SFB-rat-Yit TaxID=1041504 RepID=UPI000227A09B|nr:tRNA lysidine(34) synthetase TilS [Candidatus Arthromitus sp. SFB-rat-Yit]BAK81833.1 tRNA(Ile)-lysidine synthetase [Candidatus Arthromitus sp. SFB-rat-Yit]
MDSVLRKVKEFIISNNLISNGEIVGCALSGGADSIFMTYVLNKLSLSLGFKVLGIHVNHMLRGNDSYLDEKFSFDFCRRNNIEFKSFRVDVLDYIKKYKVSVEMGGREVRYNIFNDLKNKNIITKCALAHHADDDVETIIMRIFNGTGIDGIEGIKVKREDFYIRPILCLRRIEDIEKYLNDNDIKFVIDKSNLSEDYLRNKIRISLIPKINESFSKDISKNILNLKEISSYDNDYFLNIVMDFINKYVSINPNYMTIDKYIFTLHKSILYRIIRKCIFMFCGDIKNISFKHIKYIEELLSKNTYKSIQIKKDLFAVNYHDFIKFLRKDQSILEEESVSFELINNEDILKLKSGEIDFIGRSINFLGKNMKISFEVVENQTHLLDLTLKYEKYFSMESLREAISIRNRRNGDLFKPFGMEKHKKLKDFFINEKVSNRSSIPLICFDDKIIWIVGIRNSNDYKVNSCTKKLLKIKLDFVAEGIYDK